MNQGLAIATEKQSSNVFSFSRECKYHFYPTEEYQASIGDMSVSLGFVSCQSQRDRIYQLRESIYQDNMSYLLNTDDGLPASADKFDAISYIFYCRQGDRIIASCRYTPAINGEWESPGVTKAANLVPANKSQMLEIGRLLVAPEYRSQMISELLVWAASDWLGQNTRYKYFYAVCVPALVRFYRHFGSQSIPKTKIVLPERQNKSYRIVYGSMNRVANTLEEYITEREGLLSYPAQQESINYLQVS